MTTKIQLRPIQPEALTAALTLRDLTDPADGAHAMQLLVGEIVTALAARFRCRVLLHRSSALTSVADNYDRLHYPAAGIARDARYTRYVDGNRLLRTHSTAMIPPLLRALAAARVEDVLLVCPGMVYRRDCIDRLHAAEPHQMDLWRLRAGETALGTRDLKDMVGAVVAAALPGAAHRTLDAQHPYTHDGLQIDVAADGDFVEVGECGVAAPGVLAEAGLPQNVSGLAMGLGLDRLLMLRKGLDDIRLLRSGDPEVVRQMADLARYRPVSRRPLTKRDLSIAVDRLTSPEELGDQVRSALGSRAASVEEVSVLSESAYAELPAQAVARLGLAPHQKNVLLRVSLRDLDRTLTSAEANALRDDIYAALHAGSVHEWASRSQ